MSGSCYFALLFAFCLTAAANSAEQTDWSGGPGIQEPVHLWGDRFSCSLSLNWFDSPGDLQLQPGVSEQMIADNFGNASFIACEDLDNDGDIDVACASYGDDELAWFENLASGQSWQKHIIEFPLPSACVISSGDMDGDGIPDIMCASEGGDGICWWKNINWAENWEKREVDTTCNYPFSVEPSDFDMDNDVDLCAALYGRNEIVWYENLDSIGTVWEKHLIEDGYSNAWWAVPADFDLDGIVDVAGSRYGGEISWWKNDGSGGFQVQREITGDFLFCTTIRNCNLNGDSLPDIVASSNGGRISWWENTDHGVNWVEHCIDSDLSGSWSLWACDLDNDGDQDVTGNDRKGDCVYWYENLEGNGTLWMRHVLNQGMDMSNDVHAADLDNDGYSDPIATFGGDDTIYWWKLRQGYALEGSLESSVLDAGEDAEWGELVWWATEPSETGVSVLVRAFNSPDDPGEWVEVPLSGTDLSQLLPQYTRYIQYRIEMFSPGDDTPVFSGILLGWDPMGIGGEESFGPLMGTPRPNPSRGLMEIPLRETPGGTLHIYDQSGRKVGSGTVEAGAERITINCTGLPSGRYMVVLQSSGENQTEAFTLLEQ